MIRGWGVSSPLLPLLLLLPLVLRVSTAVQQPRECLWDVRQAEQYLSEHIQFFLRWVMECVCVQHANNHKSMSQACRCL